MIMVLNVGLIFGNCVCSPGWMSLKWVGFCGVVVTSLKMGRIASDLICVLPPNLFYSPFVYKKNSKPINER